MFYSRSVFGAFACLLGISLASPQDAWSLRHFKTLVAFGDSYTDESRLNYFMTHHGSAPPVGWVNPMNNDTASGGYTWARFVADYAGISLYDYAVSGAACSNNITPRFFSYIDAPFPSVLEYEVPAYIADSHYVTASGGRFLHIPPHETVYSIWIGTNDLGNYAFITDSQVANKTIPDYIACVYSALDKIYENGGRFFVLMNIAPLQLAPLYATPEHYGVGPNHYWPDKPSNLTAISYRMWEQVASVNNAFKYQTPFELIIQNRYPGARFALMDMFGLFTDIYNHPTSYLNGSAPANVTGFDKHCDLNGTTCTRLPNSDSFMWFDELHPSQRTNQIIARNFIDVVKGNSAWATYW